MSEQAPFFVDNEVIVLNKNGTWIADGHEITHEPTRKLFSKSLFHDDLGYQLRIGRETKRIQVEDTAYFIHRVDHPAKNGITTETVIWVNDDQQENLDPKTLTYVPGRLTCKILRHGKTEEAKFVSPAYFDILSDLHENEREYFILFPHLGKDQKIVLMSKI